VSCHGFFTVGHKEFGSLLITDSTTAAKTRSLGLGPKNSDFTTIITIQFYSTVITSKISLLSIAAIPQFHPYPRFLATSDFSVDFLQHFLINGIIQYAVFWIQLLLLGKLLSPTYIISVIGSFLFLNNSSLYIPHFHSLLINICVIFRSGLLWIMQQLTSMYMSLNVCSVMLGAFLGVELLGSPIPKNRLLGDMVICTWLSKNCQSIFQNGCTILKSHQQCMKITVSLHSRDLLLSLFYYSHPSGCEVFLWFHLAFPSCWRFWRVFLCAYWSFICLLWQEVYLSATF
jgi:hypothetical protein